MMHSITTKKNATIIIWTARVLGFCTTLFFLSFMVGEGLPNIIGGRGRELLRFLPFLSIAIIGYGFAWYKELIGGLFLIGGAFLMMSYHFSHDDLSMALVYGLPFMITGSLFFIGWKIKDRLKKNTG